MQQRPAKAAQSWGGDGAFGAAACGGVYGVKTAWAKVVKLPGLPAATS